MVTITMPKRRERLSKRQIGWLAMIVLIGWLAYDSATHSPASDHHLLLAVNALEVEVQTDGTSTSTNSSNSSNNINPHFMDVVNQARVAFMQKYIDSFSAFKQKAYHPTLAPYIHLVNRTGHGFGPLLTFQAALSMADHVWGNTKELTNIQVDIDHTRIKPGDTLFLFNSIHNLRRFFQDKYPKINTPFVLITSGGIISCPGKEYEHVLQDDKLLMWYAKNPDRVHPKITALPVGFFIDPTSAAWTPDQNFLIEPVRPFQQRKYSMFSIMSHKTSPDREVAARFACRLTPALCENTQGKRYSDRVSPRDFRNNMADSRYVVAPR